MAQWSHGSHTLFAKLVYYGPALGGKTTNLEELHRLVDPEAATKLLTIKTADDRTLFFDLLPFELSNVMGYRIVLKLYTVPGQVRYDATRRIVLAGADAVVFVADSSRGREAENRGSLENLRLNMRANGLDPSTLPILYQFNKQDLEDAAPPSDVALWLGTDPAAGFAAVAVRGEGVLETFAAATRAMVERIASLGGARARGRLDPAELGRQVDRAFAPHLARLAAARRAAPAAAARTSVVLEGEDILEESVRASLVLGDGLAEQTMRAQRLEREAEALRSLSDALRKTGPSFDRQVIVDSALAAAGGALGAAQVTLLREGTDGGPELERAWRPPGDPLLGFPEGRALAARLIAGRVATVVDDLRADFRTAPAPEALLRVRAAAAAPVDADAPGILVAYAPAPDGALGERDVRFLSTVAGHLSAGLDKARVHEELTRHRDRLEETVRLRTEALRKAYYDLRELDRMKDRFLSNLSHELRSPVTAIVSAATALRDYAGTPEIRAEMAGAILEAARALDGLLGSVFRLVGLESGARPLQVGEADPADIVRTAIELSGVLGVTLQSAQGLGPVSLDAARIAQALANLLHNAVKFSPPGAPVAIRIAPARLRRGGEVVDGVAFSVLDRGPGIPAGDRERVFAPFEQGGDPLTGKPSGVGLGLYEARCIAGMHGGALNWHEREEGGSEFRLVVPRRSDQDAEAAEVALA